MALVWSLMRERAACFVKVLVHRITAYFLSGLCAKLRARQRQVYQTLGKYL